MQYIPGAAGHSGGTLLRPPPLFFLFCEADWPPVEVSDAILGPVDWGAGSLAFVQICFFAL